MDEEGEEEEEEEEEEMVVVMVEVMVTREPGSNSQPFGNELNTIQQSHSIPLC